MTNGAITIIGAATSAGSHHAGQEHAPAALRAAGFAARLRAAGLDVADLGDVAHARFAPDDIAATARGLATVVRVAREIADVVAAAVAEGLPVVLGGDCTITLGVVAGVQRHYPDAALVYVDGDADLATPEATSSGVLDAMGIAHLLGLADTPLARLDGRWPMLGPDRLALVGYDESDPESHRAELLAGLPGLARFPDHGFAPTPPAVPPRALAAVSSAADGIIVHFDVDAVDSRDLPLANFPHYGTGVPLASAAEVLTACYRAPGLGRPC